MIMMMMMLFGNKVKEKLWFCSAPRDDHQGPSRRGPHPPGPPTPPPSLHDPDVKDLLTLEYPQNLKLQQGLLIPLKAAVPSQNLTHSRMFSLIHPVLFFCPSGHPEVQKLSCFL